MITERVGDVLEQPDLTHVAHQCNLYHTFGAGLAAQIKKKWPHAAQVDRRTTERGDRGKLGAYSVAEPRNGSPFVVNLYTQGDWRTHYPSLRHALTTLEARLRVSSANGEAVRLGVPFRLGCGLASGSWSKVYGIVEDVFGRSPVDVVVCRRPEDL